MENSQGNWAKPPRSLTMDGTAVARMVESIATRPVDSMSAMRMGPRSERKPTLLGSLLLARLPALRRVLPVSGVLELTVSFGKEFVYSPPGSGVGVCAVIRPVAVFPARAVVRRGVECDRCRRWRAG